MNQLSADLKAARALPRFRKRALYGMGRRGERHAAMPYVCGQCSASGVKLWREWNTFLCFQSLRCARCCTTMTVDENGTVRLADLSGYGDTFAHSNQRTCQIGEPSRAPAMPAGRSFWGYSSAPDEAVAKWRALPTYPTGGAGEKAEVGR